MRGKTVFLETMGCQMNVLDSELVLGRLRAAGYVRPGKMTTADVVLLTKGKSGQPLYSRLWSSGFLASSHQGVQFRPGKDPVLYLNNPDGVGRESRRALLNRLQELHEISLGGHGDGSLEKRIAQYEMAFRMQTSLRPGAGLFRKLEII